MPEYKLHYFNGRGLAEPIRLLFALAEVEYEDNRISIVPGEPHDIPQDLKQKLPYGQVPLLEFGGVTLSQSKTIARFLARQFNFLGDCDVEAAKIDELIDAQMDFVGSYQPLWLAKDEAEQTAAKKNIVEVVVPKYFGKFNEILEKSATGYLIGKKVSLADLYLFNLVESVLHMVDLDLTKVYKGVKRLREEIGSIPQIKKWVESRPDTFY